MKTTHQLHWNINVGKKMLAAILVITGMSAISSVARAQAVDMGAALGYSTLNLDSPTPSTQTAITDAFNAGTFVNNMNSSSANASANGFFLSPTLLAVHNTTTIQLSSSNSIYDFATIQLSGGTLDINGPSGDKVILYLNGELTLTGGNILVSGGLSSKNVLVYLSGSTAGTGVINNATVDGTILAPQRDVVVEGTSVVQGGVYANQVTVNSPAEVVSPEFAQ